MVRGVFEGHLVVSNLERSALFYEQVLGLEPALAVEGIRFYWVGGRGAGLLALWQHDPNAVRHDLTAPDRSSMSRQHLAFSVSPPDFKGAVQGLTERGVRVQNFRGETEAPPLVHAWMPAVSVYFPDPDGHALELIAMLPDPPRPDLGIVAWNEWEAMHGRS